MHRSRLAVLLFAAHSAIYARQAAGQYNVTGSVVNYATGEPIRRALVAVGGSLVFTGADGRFEAENVPEGRTMVSAQKPGYSDCASIDCNVNSSQATKAITVHSGSNEVVLKLVPEAKISGRVVDEDGEPVSNVQVVAESEHFFSGVKQFRTDAAATTDENGNFSIEKLQPGNYTIKTLPRPAFLFNYPGGDEPPEIYPARFYPNTPDVSAAQTLELKAGQVGDADFTLASVVAYKITGFVTPAVPSLFVAAADSTGEETLLQTQFVPATGKFVTFVPAGTWNLRFDGRDNEGHSYWAFETTTIGLANTANLRVILQPLTSVPVNIVDRSNENAQGVRVVLVPREQRWRGGVFGGYPPPPKPEMPYVVPDVPPGKYDVQVMAGNECIDSVTSGNTDLTREDLVISPGSQAQPINVTVRRDCATLQVSVRAENQNARSMVVVIPESHAIAPSTVQVEPGASPASIANLSPGEYEIYAFSNIEGLEYANPEVMRGFSGQQITLSANQHASATLDVIDRGEK